MKILVTGANGFIGQTLCRALLEKGHEVRAAFRSKEKIIDDFNGMGCSIVGDIGPTTNWHDALRGIEIVVHAAGRAHVMEEKASDPLGEFRRVNTEGTKRLAQMAVEAGVKRFIFLSTIKVLGEESDKENPFCETDIPSPQDDYALSKWEAEKALYEFSSDGKFELVVIRLPLVYGPRVKGNFLRLLKIVDKGIYLPFSLVKNCRSLIYLGNAVDAIISCVNLSQVSQEVFLISDCEDISTPELISSIAKALGRPSRLIAIPVAILRLLALLGNKTENMRRLLGSLTVNANKIRKMTGWSPRYRLADGLNETAKWYLKEKGI